MEAGSRGPSIIAQVNTQLSALERRDQELWLIVVVTSVVVGAVLLAVIFPGVFMSQQPMRLNIEAPRQLYFGLVAMLSLFNIYVVTRRSALRRTRSEVVTNAIEGELLRLQSFTDPLTEVYNRRSLEDMAAKYKSRASRLNKPLTLMLIDIDRFREVNSRFGHLLGDFVIAETATLLRTATRGSDALIRYGGDEFLIILADSELQGSTVVCKRITTSVDEWNKSGHLEEFELSLSMGLSEWIEGKSLDQVLSEADQAMYARKKGTRGRGGAQSPSPLLKKAGEAA